MRGLCMRCYRAAKMMVSEGKTTWEELALRELCEDVENPFIEAYKKATENKNASGQ